MGEEGKMINTPQVIFVDPDHIERDLASPVIRGLVEQHYTIGPAMLWQDAPGSDPKLALIMIPAPVTKINRLRLLCLAASTVMLIALVSIEIYKMVNL